MSQGAAAHVQHGFPVCHLHLNPQVKPNQQLSVLQVRLKAVVEYVTEVLSHTIKERCMKAAVAGTCRAMAAQLRTEAGQRLASATESSTALTADILRSQLQLAVPLLLLDASTKVCRTTMVHPSSVQGSASATCNEP